ncbi:MAG: DUF2924 domain-containing protein [Pseudomonadota bacterium]
MKRSPTCQVTDLTDLSRDELKGLWEEEIGSAVPPRISRSTLRRILINGRQWAASGQSRTQYLKKLKRIVGAHSSAKPTAHAGNRLIREWNGQQYVVDVLPNGYLWNGKTWRSLSAIAKEITGTKWSGPRFFGVLA